MAAFSSFPGSRPFPHRFLRKLARCAALAALLASCKAWGDFTNPVDPEAGNYQGYSTVTSVAEVAPEYPSSGAHPLWLEFKCAKAGTAVSYAFQFADSADFSADSILHNAEGDSNVLSLSAADATAFEAGKAYYWRVRAAASPGSWGAWSAASSFSPEGADGTKVSPPDAGGTIDTTPQLGWAAATGAASYQLRVAATAAGLESAGILSPSGRSYDLTETLAVGDKRYWSVRPIRADGTAGAWSEAFSFAVHEMAASELLSSILASTGRFTPSFDPYLETATFVIPSSSSTVSFTATAASATANTYLYYYQNSVWTGARSGSASPPLTLQDGDSLIIKVGSTDATHGYTIAVRKASADPLLSYLLSSVGTLSPAFAPETYAYDCGKVEYSQSSVRITATAANHAAIRASRFIGGGAWKDLVSGEPSEPFPLALGANSFMVQTSAEDLSVTREYTIAIEREALSADPSLSSLALSDGTLSPSFTADGTAYTATVGPAVSSISLTPMTTRRFAAASARVNGGAWQSVSRGYSSPALALVTGSNTVEVQVLAEDGLASRLYSIAVTRQSANANLSSLSLSEATFAPAFDKSVLTGYAASVGSALSSITVNATAEGQGATVEARINGGAWSALGASGLALSLATGDNALEVRVTAEDGATSRTYSATIRRLSADAALSSLVLGAGTLSPAFTSGTLLYTASVPFSDGSSFKLTPTASSAAATIRARVGNSAWGTVPSGSASAALPLALGTNTVEVEVQPEDAAIAAWTYTITATRLAASTVAELAGLSVDGAAPSPAFSATTENYTAKVAYDATSVSITASPAHPKATMMARVGSGSWQALTSGLASSLALPAAPAAPGTVELQVTPEDTAATKKSYYLTLSRKSDDATLSALALSAGSLTATFSPTTYAYSTAALASGTASTTITATRANAAASIKARLGGAGAWIDLSSGIASSALALAVGDNSLEVQVTAEDSAYTQVYTIAVRRMSAVADLTVLDLTLAVGLATEAVDFGFNQATTSYSLDAEFGWAYANVKATTVVSAFSIEYRMNSGSWVGRDSGNSYSIGLSPGANALQFRVTPEDTAAPTKTYTLTITRLDTNPTTSLDGISTAVGPCVPSFSPGTYSYTIEHQYYSQNSAYFTITKAYRFQSILVDVNYSGSWNGASADYGFPTVQLNFSLPTQNTTFRIRACAEGSGGGTYTDYIVTVTRPAASADATLSALTLSDYGGSISLSPTFASGTVSYTATSHNYYSSVAITLAKNQIYQKIEVSRDGGATFSLYTYPGNTPNVWNPTISVGVNNFAIRVTAEDAATTKTYSIQVTRPM